MGQFKFVLLATNPISSTPQQATATVSSRVNNSIDAVTLTNGGEGYLVRPTVTVSGGGGSGAIIQVNGFNSATGEIISLSIVNSGSGYTSTPSITIAPPQPAEETFWANDNRVSPILLSEPNSSVSIPVNNGLFATRLGGVGMEALPFEILFRPNLKLRTWFAPEGSTNFQRLSPGTPLSSVPFSFISEKIVGPGSRAAGVVSNALGRNTTASGFASTTMGYRTSASGNTSTAMGERTTASNRASTAMGERTIASGDRSIAMGSATAASGAGSTAMGVSTNALGIVSTAMGERTIASGDRSIAMGSTTTASGDESIAMGFVTTASGDSSTSMGILTSARSFAELAIGSFNTDYTPNNTEAFNSNDRIFVIGNGTSNSNRSNALIIEKSGQAFFMADPGATNGNNITNYAAAIENTDSTNGADVLALKLQETTPDADSNFLAFFDGQDSIIGEIEGSSGGGVSFLSNGADYAEYLPALDTSETLVAGDVIAVRSGKITRDTSSFDQLMVISTNPIVVGNSQTNNENHHKVAFIGQVPVKVTGAVNSGDYLLASGKHDGTAIAKPASKLRTSDRAYIIGRAWDSSEETGEKLINAAVGLDLGEALVSEIRQQNVRISDLESRLISLERKLSPHPDSHSQASR